MTKMRIVAELLIHLTTMPIIIAVIYTMIQKQYNMDHISMNAKIFMICAVYFVLIVLWRLYMIHNDKQIRIQAEEHCSRIFGKDGDGEEICR